MWKHDALSLMAATKTRERMDAAVVNGRTIYERWLLPQAGLNDVITAGGKTTTRYQGRPPGNLPRLMSLDEFANKNLMDCVNSHVTRCKHQRLPQTRLGKAPRGDPDGERQDGGRPQWSSQRRS